ncbi:unnamed protein product [Musa hybrid cultivar]
MEEARGKDMPQRSCDADACSSSEPRTRPALQGLMMDSPIDQPVNPASTSPADDGSGGPRPAASKKARKRLEDCGRERLRRHRVEMAGRVCIPETWGQESSLKDWADRCAFERFMPEALASARKALVDDCRRPPNTCLQVGN